MTLCSKEQLKLAGVTGSAEPCVEWVATPSSSRFTRRKGRVLATLLVEAEESVCQIWHGIVEASTLQELQEPTSDVQVAEWFVVIIALLVGASPPFRRGPFVRRTPGPLLRRGPNDESPLAHPFSVSLL